MVGKLSNKQRLEYHKKKLPNKSSKFWIQNDKKGFKHSRILDYKRKSNAYNNYNYNEGLSFAIIFLIVISFIPIFLLLPAGNILSINFLSLPISAVYFCY
jgi:hypothetical protein